MGIKINEGNLEIAKNEIDSRLPFLTVYYDTLREHNIEWGGAQFDGGKSDIEYRHKDQCPFPDHDDSTASFTYYPETETCYCFGCMKGGGPCQFYFTFNKQLDSGFSMVRAVRELARKYSIKIPNIFELSRSAKMKLNVGDKLEFKDYRSPKIVLKKKLASAKTIEDKLAIADAIIVAESMRLSDKDKSDMYSDL